MHEQPVADVVAEGVVHELEPVDVEEQHRDVATVRGRVEQRLLEPLEELPAVRQAGERVVVRLELELLLRGAPFAHVAHVAHEPGTAGRRAGSSRRPRTSGTSRRGAGAAARSTRRRRAFHQVAKNCARVDLVVGEDLGADVLELLVAEQPQERRARVRDGAVGSAP